MIVNIPLKVDLYLRLENKKKTTEDISGGKLVENILNLQHPPKTYREQIKHL